MSFPDLNFYFSTKDANFVTKNVVVEDQPNYISHAFVRCPIYDASTKKQIGFKVSDDYVQQVAENKFIVRLNNTYHFNDKSAISWQYVFENDKPEIYYPVGVRARSTIICGTGKYIGRKGFVSLYPRPSGRRDVNIKFESL